MCKPAVGWKKTAGKRLICGILAVLFLFLGILDDPVAASPLKRQLKPITITEKIPYETTYIDLPDKYRGYTEVKRAGIQGERQLTMQVLYEGARPVKVMSIKSVETGAPVDEIVRRGTKVLRSSTADGRQWETSFIRPVRTGWLSADFYDYPHHNGVDFAAAYGTQVYAAAAGRVILSGWYGDYGKCVILEHADGSKTLYAHNSALQVQKGQQVKQGQEIAKVGSTGNSTGNHLHFEIRLKDAFLDPLVYIGK